MVFFSNIESGFMFKTIYSWVYVLEVMESQSEAQQQMEYKFVMMNTSKQTW